MHASTRSQIRQTLPDALRGVTPHDTYLEEYSKIASHENFCLAHVFTYSGASDLLPSVSPQALPITQCSSPSPYRSDFNGILGLAWKGGVSNIGVLLRAGEGGGPSRNMTCACLLGAAQVASARRHFSIPILAASCTTTPALRRASPAAVRFVGVASLHCAPRSCTYSPAFPPSICAFQLSLTLMSFVFTHEVGGAWEERKSGNA